MTKRQPEQEVHRAIANHLDKTSKKFGFWWTTFPGGGKRSKAEAAIFKGLGVRAGVADILIIAQGGKAYWLEVKTPKTATTKKTYQSKVQVTFEGHMGEHGSPYSVVRSVNDVCRAFDVWNF